MDDQPASQVTPGESFKVVIAVDKSQHADYALSYYAKNLHREGNDVCLLNIMDPPDPSSKYQSDTSWDDAMEELKKCAKNVESEYMHILEKYKIKGTFCSLVGYRTGEVIVEAANRQAADLVVMGSRGIGTLRRTILGGVSDYVMHHASCPVIVCRQGDGPEALKKVV